MHAVAAWFRGRTDVALHAIHVNHQLQAASESMASCCRQACENLNVPLTVIRVNVERGESLESQAREARYAVFDEQLQAGELLLMAHHANDQAETVLFRLIRGSGSRGLAGIPAERSLGNGRLVRPLLNLTRERLHALAVAWNLTWVDDPSNDDPSIDRNYIRHRVLEPLGSRWPGGVASIVRSARQSAEASELTHKLALLQLRDVRDEQGRLDALRLAALDVPEQKNLLRWWLIDQALEPPPASRLEQGLADLLSAAEDRMPALVGEGYVIRRFRDALYCTGHESAPIREAVAWDIREPLEWAGGRLHVLGNAVPPLALVVTSRKGGERLRPRPGGPSRPLKKWLQEQDVPPWERERIPLVWKGEELVAVAGLWLSPTLFGPPSEASWRIVWERDCR
ncbi:tRNA lysidine(34) synthetase TilS [Marinobacter fonticola]|uniref:tRNA lysidine(34) synthetase TilS n=1 Tax=Marinobacter fonticola TaxID=2603215 RepID=UPI0022287991|nr:tRNA lysidine(34) synthetase TilS [Marinobacter fonticola]